MQCSKTAVTKRFVQQAARLLMGSRRAACSTLLAVCTVSFVALYAADDDNAEPVDRPALWKQVEEAVKKGLPKTAIEHLDPIIASAMEEKAYAEAIKAIGEKIAMEGNIQGNKPEVKITLMQAEIAKAPPEMVPVMDAVLANWYWQYFQHNRWRFMQRTQTGESPGDDFETWGLARILSEIDKQFVKALTNAEQLKQIPIAQYDALLEKGTAPDAYRPTLWDFLVNNALEFYSAGEQAGAAAEDAFVLSADSVILGPADEFIRWQLETADRTSPTFKAVRLYQHLIAFHKNDEDKSAYLDADLQRLNFGYNKAFGEEKNARYKAALKKFVDQWGDHEISARALHDWASVLQQEGELVEAHEIASRGVRVWPDTVGGRECFNLIQQIEAKQSNINVERVWNDPLPQIYVRYKNLTKIYLRAVAYDYEQRIKAQNYRPENLSRAERIALLAKKPDAEWSADLPATDDYHERVEKIDVPKDLKPGFYFLVASYREDFGASDNMVTFTDFWVSNLAIVVRNRNGQGVVEGFVLDAVSGDPIDGATVKGWRRTRNNARVPLEPTKTDKNGLFRFTGIDNWGFLVLASHKDQQLSSAQDYYNYKQDQQAKPYENTVFFTDRSLYRPGQTIQYKGICIRVDQQADNYKVIPQRTLTVVFRDVNGKEIERRQQSTNDYGSFSGSFTAPTDRLMGRMTIQVEGEPRGGTGFNVEEYKRPKFQVKLDRPETAPKLNDKVSLKGTATAYTGAAINDAKVRYRVVRQVRYPYWWGWYYWWRAPQTSSQEIAHGTTMTDSGGSFEIEFVAKPDLSVAEKDEPTFNFAVYADVTDITGETRSGETSVNVGYTALQATLSSESWLTDEKAVPINIVTSTLDGVGQKAEGSLKIHALKQPDEVHRSPLGGHRPYFNPRAGGEDAKPEPDLSNPNSWELGEVVAEKGWTTDDDGKASFTFELKAGVYRAMLETQDRFGKTVTAQLPLQVLDPDAKRLEIKIPNLLAGPKWSLEPGEEFFAVWGSGYERARAFIEIEHRRKILTSYWTDPDDTQVAIKQAVDEAMRGGFTLRVTMVRENRAYLESRHVDVPWTNKQLQVKWEHFVSKLEPAQKETWTAVITGPDAAKAIAEMVAGLYDESLDAYLPHSWPSAFNVFRHDYSNLSSNFENMMKGLYHLQGQWPSQHKDAALTYRSFPARLISNLWGYQFLGKERGLGGRDPGAPMATEAAAMDAAPANGMAARQSLRRGADKSAEKRKSGDEAKGLQQGGQGQAGPDLSKVSARKNLNETAFFFPHLLAGENGEVKLEFTMPEALTKWKFYGFAHDAELRSGFLQDSVVTAKDLMVQPNPPRFLREGDELEFTVKVSNQSPTRQEGSVRLTFSDARTSKSVDAALSLATTDQTFDIPSKESRSFSWRVKVPDDMGVLSYKAVGATTRLSDGEEGFLPVLSRRIFVTESLPLPIRGQTTKKFDFTKLSQSGKSDSLQSKSLTVQMVSNPSWYAVMALPYLMEYPHQCTEQTFNRLYANSLARYIANSDPKIRGVFDQWKGTPALDSPMVKNQDLKSVMIEETPWLRQAQDESQARRNVGILFDENRLNDETARLLRKLQEQQLGDGAWPWFPGGRGNDYITLYITTGFGRLRHLGVKIDTAPAVKSLKRLDGWVTDIYNHIPADRRDKNNLSTLIAFYLYGRSFFLDDQAVADPHKEAVNYWLGQAKKYWLELACRQSQAHLAVALKRFGDVDAAKGIMASIKERSVTDEELGMFWRDTELSWWWYRAPIETQAMMIEAFDEVVNDAEAVEACRVWLLKQKQTQDWKTTKATADAIYGLLLRGTDILASDALVEVTLGDVEIKPEDVEAGTGFYEQRFVGPEIKPALGEITVKKVDEGVAWGSVHWQYLEDIAKVTPHEGTPLKLTKSLYTKEYTNQGPTLMPVQGPIKVGDELVVRITLRTDRDMEYVHMKDHRGSGTEPVNVLSKYKYQDGLAYYESTRDTASHFFIDYLPKGVYVFEYSTRVVHKGRYQTGMANIQCMYAPEFNSHSESLPLVVE